MKKLTLLLFCIFSVSTLVNAQAPRKILVEDFTGTWCGWCPNGKTVSENLAMMFSDEVINVGMHVDDELECDYSVGVSNSINNYGFPGGGIDRFWFDGQQNLIIGIPAIPTGEDWVTEVEERLNATSPVDIGITNTYNDDTKELNVTVTTSFVADATGNMRISCILVEDSIVTNDQHNYMNSMAGSPWYGTGDPIPDYVQRHTVRTHLTGNIWGTSGIIPASVTAGSVYTQSHSFTIPSGWNASKVRIVAFVNLYSNTDKHAVYILNANEAGLNESATGTVSLPGLDDVVGNAYPNPFNQLTEIPLQLSDNSHVVVRISNLMGQWVATLIDEDLVPGKHNFFWSGRDENGNPVANGIYNISVITTEGNVSRSVLLQR